MKLNPKDLKHPLAKKLAVQPNLPLPKRFSKINPHRKYTLGLLVQSLKFLFIQYRDELSGTSTLIDKEKDYVEKLVEYFGIDIAALYRLVERAPNIDIDREMNKYYECVDFANEVFETAMVLSEQHGDISGLERARKVLELIRNGDYRFAATLPPESQQAA